MRLCKKKTVTIIKHKKVSAENRDERAPDEKEGESDFERMWRFNCNYCENGNSMVPTTNKK